MTSPTYTEPPRLESGIARAGIIGVAALSAWTYWHFFHDRGDDTSAWLTLAAQAVALGGFAMMLHHGIRTFRGAGALVVTAIAALWCGLTMFEKLNDDAAQRTLEAVQATSAYQSAERDLADASARLRSINAQRAPDPETTVAQRLEAWGVNHRAELASATTERNRAQDRLDALTPQPTIDAISMIRGLGIQLAELLGLAVFGFGGLGLRANGTVSVPDAPAPAETPRRTGEVVDLKTARSEAAAALGRRSGEARRARIEARRQRA